MQAEKFIFPRNSAYLQIKFKAISKKYNGRYIEIGADSPLITSTILEAIFGQGQKLPQNCGRNRFYVFEIIILT